MIRRYRWTVTFLAIFFTVLITAGAIYGFVVALVGGTCGLILVASSKED